MGNCAVRVKDVPTTNIVRETEDDVENKRLASFAVFEPWRVSTLAADVGVHTLFVPGNLTHDVFAHGICLSGPPLGLKCRDLHNDGASVHALTTRNANCVAAVPARYAGSDKRLVCCADHIIFVVSDTGSVTPLAGHSTLSGWTDGRGDAARFQRITFCTFDTKRERLLVLDNYATIRAVDFASGDVTTLWSCGSYEIYSFAVVREASFRVNDDDGLYIIGVNGRMVKSLRPHIASIGVPGVWASPASLNDAFEDSDKIRQLVRDPATSDGMFVCTEKALWRWSPTLGRVPIVHFTPDLHTGPAARDIASIEVNDGNDVALHLIREIRRAQWPPGLAEIILDYAHPGTHLLVIDTTNRHTLWVPV